MKITKKIKTIRKKDKKITVYQNGLLFYITVENKNGKTETYLKRDFEVKAFLNNLN